MAAAPKVHIADIKQPNRSLCLVCVFVCMVSLRAFTSNALFCSPGRKHAHPTPLRCAGGSLFVACFDSLQIILLESNWPNVALPVFKNSLCSPCSFNISSCCFSLRCPSPCAQIPARPLHCLLSPPATVEAEIHSKRLKFLPHLSRSPL